MNWETNPVAVFAGMKVTIMGLGVNGGGLESARYLAQHGAECTVTDMKDEKALADSIEELEAIAAPHPPFRFVLGRHDMDDFSRADMVIKNPAVRPGSPYLAAARRIETDISLFLAVSPARLIAVTGSKGKSGTASALHWVLEKSRAAGLPGGTAFLGGNITVSPLSFLDKLTEKDDAVLELSSWQLGDLLVCGQKPGSGLINPRIAILTSIMPDHLDRYPGMEAYVNDKRIIYQGQNKEGATIACSDDTWGKSFLAETPGRPLPYSERPIKTSPGAWLDTYSGAGMAFYNDEKVTVVPPRLLVPGRHNKKNFLAAALALLDIGIPASHIQENLGSFTGIEHRLEFFHETNGIRFYNDSTATVPEAAAAAIEAFTYADDESEKSYTRLILVTGGTDKNLDFSPLAKKIKETTAAGTDLKIILLSGTGSEKLRPLLQGAGISYYGPFDTIEKAAQTSLELGQETSPSAVQKPVIVTVLSPGCTSFGMFKNEFDRGRQWKEAVRRL